MMNIINIINIINILHIDFRIICEFNVGGTTMKDKKLSFSALLAIGVMLFALFFGAGNLIFPAELGQNAGSNLWPAVFGFLITGVGLPLLGIMAMSFSGSANLQELASRVQDRESVV